MKIYTRTGDGGETALFAGPRVAKDHIRIEAFGAVDELNAYLGAIVSEEPADRFRSMVTQIQHELFALGAILATPDPTNDNINLLPEESIDRMEAEIDEMEESLTPLREFILPGGHRIASMIHVARAVCRRAERRVTTLASHESATPTITIRYLNRLADLLFVMARAYNQHENTPDVPWRKEA